MDNRKKLRFSLIASAILIVTVYLFDNIQYSFGGIPSVATILEHYRLHRQERDSVSYSADTSRVFINTGFDPSLADVQYGQVKITDREKLLRFLKELEKYNNYKEVFIDIRFEDGIESEYDSLLVEQILKMRNLFVAKHWRKDDKNHKNSSDYSLIDDRLLEHAAYADYGSTLFENSFTRYQFLQANGPSAALQIYEDIDRRHIKRFGYGFFSVFFDSWRLCFNSSFIRLAEDFSNWNYCAEKDMFFNLGEGVLGFWEVFPDTKDMFYAGLKDKIIIVGDFVFDTHDTYYKKQPGPYLTYLAYKVLHDRKHIISPVLFIGIYILYVIILLMIFHFELPRNAFSEHFDRLRERMRATANKVLGMKFFRWTNGIKRLLRFLVSLIGYSALFSFVSVVLYVAFEVSISVFIPSLFFSVLDYGYKYSTYEK